MPSRPRYALLGAVLLALPLANVALAAADHLVFTRIVARASSAVSPFIEIANPTPAAVVLSDVYLTNAQNTQLSLYYWNLVTGGECGGGASDFHCRFPDGMSIAAGDTIVVAIRGSASYQAAYGRLPDLELYEDAAAPDQVPEMRQVRAGSIGAGLGNVITSEPQLGETFDSLVLYTWDGAGDLVKDIDYVYYGGDTGLRTRVDKTNVAVDGPDAGSETSTYAPDTAANLQQAANASLPSNPNQCLARNTFDEPGEVTTGGNGVTGHNETGERLGTSWDPALTAAPAGPPALFRTSPIVTTASISPEAPQSNTPVTLRATVLSYDPLTEVRFHWQVNANPAQEQQGAAGDNNLWTVDLPGLAGGDTVAWYVSAVTTAGAGTVHPFGGAAGAYEFAIVDPPPPPPPPAKLLLTEVCYLPSPAEFIEIYNPNDVDVELQDYYLTDAVHNPGQYYWRIVEPNPSQTTVGGGLYNDFHARFPAGAVLPAREVITIALLGSGGFEAAFGRAPDYELFEDGDAPDDIPEMAEAFPGGIGAPDPVFGLLTNPSTTASAGEPVVLYYWDGEYDLVWDVDIVRWGVGNTENGFSKTGEREDGPDADNVRTAYAEETAASQQNSLGYTAGAQSFSRLDPEEGTQVRIGGNGINGDELSENWRTTFIAQTASPGRVRFSGGTGTSVVLTVPPRTFLPRQGETMKIRFVSRDKSETKLRIFDLDGRLVATLFDSNLNGAPSTFLDEPTEVVWDGRDETFAPVKAGMYIAHLSAVDIASGEETIKTAPVVVATRLQK